MTRIVLDPAELADLAGRYGAAAADAAALAARVQACVTAPALVGAAVLDPIGVARAEARLEWCVLGPGGLLQTAARLAEHAASLRLIEGEAVVAGAVRSLATDVLDAVAALGGEAAGAGRAFWGEIKDDLKRVPSEVAAGAGAAVALLAPFLEAPYRNEPLAGGWRRLGSFIRPPFPLPPIMHVPGVPGWPLPVPVLPGPFRIPLLPGPVPVPRFLVPVLPGPFAGLRFLGGLLPAPLPALQAGLTITRTSPTARLSGRLFTQLAPDGVGATEEISRPQGFQEIRAASLGDYLRRVDELSGKSGAIAVTRLGGDSPRYVLLLPGIASFGVTRYPQDLYGAVIEEEASQEAPTPEPPPRRSPRPACPTEPKS